MSFGYLHIYGFDLTPEGKLGSRTIKRLKKGLQVQKRTRCILVVSAQVSPRHERIQSAPMAEMMYEWLVTHMANAHLILKLSAPTFNTEGECQIFCQTKTFGRKAHCSSWWHLPRVFLLTLRYRSKGEPLPLLVPVWDLPSVKMSGLEVAKIIAMFLPRSWQEGLKSGFEKLTGKTTSF